MRPLEDLRTATIAGAAAQTSIEHADMKASLLLGALGGPVAVAVGQLGLVAAAVRAGALPAAGLAAIGLASVVGLVVGAWHLGRCLAPRLAVPESQLGNRFVLPALARRPSSVAPVPVEQQRDEAWVAAGLLADIAMQKYRAIRASLPWLALAGGGSIVWLCAAPFLSVG